MKALPPLLPSSLMAVGTFIFLNKKRYFFLNGKPFTPLTTSYGAIKKTTLFLILAASLTYGGGVLFLFPSPLLLNLTQQAYVKNVLEKIIMFCLYNSTFMNNIKF